MKIKCRTEAKKVHVVYDKYSASAMQFRVGIQHSLESTVQTGGGYGYIVHIFMLTVSDDGIFGPAC